MIDALKTGSGRLLAGPGLSETPLPVPYDAAAFPGASVLGTDGQVYQSIKIGGIYAWAKNAISLPTGEILLGTITQARANFLVRLDLGGVPFIPSLQVESTDEDLAAISITASSGAVNAFAPRLIMARTRSATAGGNDAVANNDATASILFMGSDGTSLAAGAGISSQVRGTVATADMPMEMFLRSRAQGATAPVRVLTVSPAGNIQINNTTGTERLSVTGNIQVTDVANGFRVGPNQVLGARRTGWTAPTGTATRTSFDTATVTLAGLAERVKALIDDFIAHGSLGA